ncbi:MAG: NAD-dependent succinate-semialdehyde dehydrogenase [Candidatus Latescibacteria bacterium]|nr:NAD-dependent succinate-semialdehyde dehydrogenase [Candidatus Latescibacterota bacterium]
MKAVNPATGEVIREYQESSLAEVEEQIGRTHEAFLSWRETSFGYRSELVAKAGGILRERKEDYARLMTAEMGKPIAEARAEIEKCAWVCDYYAENTEAFLTPETVVTTASRSYVTFQPLGVVLAIMPWNFPFWQVLRFGAPALMAGNAALLKHAPSTPGCALAIEGILQEAGFPEDLFKSLLVGVEHVEAIIEHPLVRAVTLTGSTRAGREVAKKAGEMLKKTVLELGGNDPYIILEDADLESAIEACATARLINSGQSCIAAKRIIVLQSQKEQLEKALVDEMSGWKMGDPMEEDTRIGPIARMDLRDNLHRQVKESVEKGARLLVGGELPEGHGTFYPVTVLTDVAKGMPAYEEELFGPVAAIIGVGDEAEALEVANDTVYGLGAAVFTGDLAKGEQIAAEKLEAGSCFVNDFVRSDPRLPFGGIKDSGYGRELSSFGIREFVNIKTVYIK